MKIARSVSHALCCTALLLCCSTGIVVSDACGDIIIDNGDPGCSYTGKWEWSCGKGRYGKDGLWARNGATYTWAFEKQPEGKYEVLMWWSGAPSRASANEVSIKHAEGTEVLLIDQRGGAGRWNSLGEYQFKGTGSVTIVAAEGKTISTSADAVWFRQTDKEGQVVIDNCDKRTSRRGKWYVSRTPGHYGNNSLCGWNGATFTWHFVPAETGEYEVSMWWTEWRSRSSECPVDIRHADGKERVTVNQQTNGGRWNSLGVFKFEKGAKHSVTIWAKSKYPTSYSADAVKFTPVAPGNAPVANIESFEPDPAKAGDTVVFKGWGKKTDNEIVAYNWASSIDGELSDQDVFSTDKLSEGRHEICFKVQDASGRWSEPVKRHLLVEARPVEVVIDNDDEKTSKTGTWEISGGQNAYGGDAVWARDGATFTWHFDPPQSGDYEVSMWWSAWPSRSSAARVEIVYGRGTDKISVNQKTGGGRWNALGVYAFEKGTEGSVTLYADDGEPTSYCADAVRFVKVLEPAVADFTVDKVRGPVPFTVKFSNQSTRYADEWHWDFGDGNTSSERSPSHTYTTPGVRTVALTATTQGRKHTARRYSLIDAKADKVENIFLCNGYTGNDFLLRDVGKTMQEMNATKTDGGWTCQPAGSEMTYNIIVVNDKQGVVEGFYEEDAHVVIAGHGNYGFGLVFATPEETLHNRIERYRYADDDCVVVYSNEAVSTKVDGMKYGQSYPNWEPVFKDGRNAIRPYEFGDPRGNPPYNYYLTYRVADDPTHYRIKIDGDYMEKYPGCGRAAWYSPQGFKPDPKLHPEYFIGNPGEDYNRFDCVGEWKGARIPGAGFTGDGGYMGYNFQIQHPGTGGKAAAWTMVLKHAGEYEVLANWPALDGNATDARYTIHHADGATVVTADQTRTERRNSLGVFTFNAGVAKVELSDKANGNVIADAVILRPVADPRKIVAAEFSVDKSQGALPLKVSFKDRSVCYSDEYSSKIAEWHWDFGDGSTSRESNPTHIYTVAGIHTVKLRVVSSEGIERTIEKADFIAVDVKPALKANFRASRLWCVEDDCIQFHDMSSGDIERWHWDFGDGKQSSESSPAHQYAGPGVYAVRLTVSGPGGSDTETAEDYICVVIGESYTDNSFQTKPHYYSRGYCTFAMAICSAGQPALDKSKLRHSRLFHGSCASFTYWGTMFDRGIMYGKHGITEVENDTSANYLKWYLQGYSDEDICQRLNKIENIHSFYNFDEKPPSTM